MESQNTGLAWNTKGFLQSTPHKEILPITQVMEISPLPAATAPVRSVTSARRIAGLRSSAVDSCRVPTS